MEVKASRSGQVDEIGPDLAELGDLAGEELPALEFPAGIAVEPKAFRGPNPLGFELEAVHCPGQSADDLDGTQEMKLEADHGAFRLVDPRPPGRASRANARMTRSTPLYFFSRPR